MNEPPRRRTLGSRYLYEPFDSAHARIETHERVFEERWVALNRVLGQIESGWKGWSGGSGWRFMARLSRWRGKFSLLF